MIFLGFLYFYTFFIGFLFFVFKITTVISKVKNNTHIANPFKFWGRGLLGGSWVVGSTFSLKNESL